MNVFPPSDPLQKKKNPTFFAILTSSDLIFNGNLMEIRSLNQEG